MTLLRSLLGRDEKAFTQTADDWSWVREMPLAMVGSLFLADDYTASYYAMWERQLWVRKAVNKLAWDIARLPLKVYRRTPDGRERVTDSPLAMLLLQPNGTKDAGSQFLFIARIVSDLLIYGNAMVTKVQARPGQMPTEMYPSSPRGWFLNDAGQYVRRSPVSGKERTYESWEVMHLMEPGPTEQQFGVSRLESARLTLAIEYAAQTLGAATFRNGARPGGIINVKSGLPSGNDQRAAAIQRFKAEIQTRFGGVSKAGLPAVLEGDVNWLAMSHNLDDSAVVEHRQLTRTEIAAVYDIPQPTMGFLDEANFASIDALDLKYFRDTLSPLVALVEQAFEAQLLRGTVGLEQQYLEFDLNAVMRGALLQRMQAYQIAINSRIMTPDEARQYENMPPMAAEQPEAGLLQFPLNYGVSPTPAGLEGP